MVKRVSLDPTDDTFYLQFITGCGHIPLAEWDDEIWMFQWHHWKWKWGKYGIRARRENMPPSSQTKEKFLLETPQKMGLPQQWPQGGGRTAPSATPTLYAEPDLDAKEHVLSVSSYLSCNRAHLNVKNKNQSVSVRQCYMWYHVDRQALGKSSNSRAGGGAVAIQGKPRCQVW